MIHHSLLNGFLIWLHISNYININLVTNFCFSCYKIVILVIKIKTLFHVSVRMLIFLLLINFKLKSFWSEISVVIWRRVEGSFFFLGVCVVFSPLRICKWCQVLHVLLFSVVSIAVVKLLCMLYMLCPMWEYHFIALLDIVFDPVLWWDTR
jgi:hypothetical protein